MSRSKNAIDLTLALRVLHEHALGDGDLGGEYWNSVIELLSSVGQTHGQPPSRQSGLSARDGGHAMSDADCTATLSTRGRLTVPLAIRSRLGLRPGDGLVFELQGDGTLIAHVADKDLANASRPSP